MGSSGGMTAGSSSTSFAVWTCTSSSGTVEMEEDPVEVRESFPSLESLESLAFRSGSGHEVIETLSVEGYP